MVFLLCFIREGAYAVQREIRKTMGFLIGFAAIQNLWSAVLAWLIYVKFRELDYLIPEVHLIFGVAVFNFSKDLAKFVYIFVEREDAAK